MSLGLIRLTQDCIKQRNRFLYLKELLINWGMKKIMFNVVLIFVDNKIHSKDKK